MYSDSPKRLRAPQNVNSIDGRIRKKRRLVRLHDTLDSGSRFSFAKQPAFDFHANMPDRKPVREQAQDGYERAF